MKKFLIIFQGVDGAGKTTLAKKTIDIFNNTYNMKCKYFWFRSKIQIHISHILSKFKQKNKVKGDSKNKINSNRSIFSKIYLHIILLDYFIKTLLFIKIPLFLGYNVICDRYIYDVILDLASDFHYSENKTKKLINSKLFLKPDIIYLINISSDIVKNRRLEHSVEEINLKIKFLNKFKSYYSLNSKIIDLNGSEEINVILTKIKSSLIENNVVIKNE